LKQRVETAQQEADKAEGALGEVMKQLQREFDCRTLADAKRKLKQLRRKEEASEKEFEDALEKFEDTWDESD
jgi:hypothetical protein